MTKKNSEYSMELQPGYSWAHVFHIAKNVWIHNCQVKRVGADRVVIVSLTETREVPTNRVEIQWLNEREPEQRDVAEHYIGEVE